MRYFLAIVSSVFLMTCVVGQRQGDLCVVADQPGVCRHVSKCSVALEAAVLGTPPKMCVSPDNMIVCCPWVPGQETRLEVKCQANKTTHREGDNCTKKDNGTAGVCRPFANCQTAKEAASRGTLPQRCDLSDNESELVCCIESACPPLPKGLVTQLPIGSKAADYCIELAEKIYPCQQTSFGWTRGDMCPLSPLVSGSNTQHRIVMTTTSEAPYYGRIGLGERENIDWVVNPVTLVSDRWVICAASSFEYAKFVGLGGSFSPQYDPDAIYDVTTKHCHPLYNASYSNVYYDIALLQLDRPVTFTNRIFPACLHTGTPLPNSGLIYTSSEGSSEPERKTTMQRVPQDECSRIIPAGSYNHPDGVRHDLEICSRPVKTGVSCPVWFHGVQLSLDNSPRVACTHLLVGLASYRDHSPCTFTHSRISAFIPWIESIVWP